MLEVIVTVVAIYATLTFLGFCIAASAGREVPEMPAHIDYTKI